MAVTDGAGSPGAPLGGRRGAHAPVLRRWLPLVAVVAVLAGAGVITRSATPAAPAATPTAAAPMAVPPAAAESSSWYCTGGTGSSTTLATPTVYLTNTTDRTVTGTVHVVGDTGSTGSAPVTVAPEAQVALAPGNLASGSWLAATIDLEGGGVAATESVHGPAGWSEAPCAGSTSPTWDFASGSTAGGNDLFISMYNPTPSLAVADMSFTDASGVEHPAPFQGVTVPAGGVVVADAGSFVQNQPSVATSVVTRSGRLVVSALEIATRARKGLSLRLGATGPSSTWAVPRAIDVAGGSSTLDVFNPTAALETVQVSFHLASGSPAPLSQQVGPGSTWALDLSSLTRLPRNDSYSLSVAAAGGPGVIVDRVVQSPPSEPLPQWGSSPAVDSSQWSTGARTWELPGPGLPGRPATGGAYPLAVTVWNQSDRTVTTRLWVQSASGASPLVAPLQLAPGASVMLPWTPVLTHAGRQPMFVTASGPVAVSEDLTPSGAPGVVTLPGLPLG